MEREHECLTSTVYLQFGLRHSPRFGFHFLQEQESLRGFGSNNGVYAMDLAIFTLVHVLISLAGIGTGFAVVGGWLGGRNFPRWTAWFLATTALTSVTGCFFPFKGFTPPYAFAILSLLVLAVAAYALYARRLTGRWRNVYLVCGVAALYLNFFVLIAQLFLRSPALHQLAPTGTEPAFGITQGLVLLLFLWLGRTVLSRFPA